MVAMRKTGEPLRFNYDWDNLNTGFSNNTIKTHGIDFWQSFMFMKFLRRS